MKSDKERKRNGINHLPLKANGRYTFQNQLRVVYHSCYGKKIFMDKIFICSPYRKDVKKKIENMKRYYGYFSYEGIPIVSHLYFTRFMDERYNRYKGRRLGKALLAECKEMYVFVDEVTKLLRR